MGIWVAAALARERGGGGRGGQSPEVQGEATVQGPGSSQAQAGNVESVTLAIPPASDTLEFEG